MYDSWVRDLEPTLTILFFSIVILLPIQLLICFKIKSLIIRLLPIILLSIPTIYHIGMFLTSNTGWSRLGYLLLAYYTGSMILSCTIGWIIWGITQFFKHKRAKI